MTRVITGKVEEWSAEWDEDHPIQWRSAGGQEPDRYCTLNEAVRRLVGYGYVATEARDMLVRDGATLRTPFAFYSLRTV